MLCTHLLSSILATLRVVKHKGRVRCVSVTDRLTLGAMMGLEDSKEWPIVEDGVRLKGLSVSSV